MTDEERAHVRSEIDGLLQQLRPGAAVLAATRIMMQKALRDPAITPAQLGLFQACRELLPGLRVLRDEFIAMIELLEALGPQRPQADA